MMNVDLIWAGWNTTGTSDKVWGVIKQGGAPVNQTSAFRSYYKPLGIAEGTKIYIFWGARGKSMSFKEDTMTYSVVNLKTSKEKKGYKEIDYKKLLEIWPDFEDTLSQRFTFFLLSH